MNVKQIIDTASTAEFYTRVSFLAIQIAHEKAATLGSDEADIAYGNRVLAGYDDPLLLSMHVIAADSVIAKSLEDGAEVTDADLKKGIENIWHTRAVALAAPPPQALPPVGDTLPMDIAAPLDESAVPKRADHDNPPPPPPMLGTATPRAPMTTVTEAPPIVEPQKGKTKK